MTVRYRHCLQAEDDHIYDRRIYAHTFHKPNIICTCKALWKLPRKHRDVILLHEVGHLLAGPKGNERDANREIEKLTGVKIRYVDSLYGDDLESLSE